MIGQTNVPEAISGGNVVLLPDIQVIVRTKAGAFTDSDSDADGYIGIDKTNGRLYFRHSGGTWQYVAALITQSEMNLTAAASATQQAARYDELVAEHNADGSHKQAFDVVGLPDAPVPKSWQHKAIATGSQYGTLRIEWGNDTLAAGTKAITFQQAFATILEVFTQDKTGANAMYPSAVGTSGFTANGTGTDDFAWLAIGVD